MTTDPTRLLVMVLNDPGRLDEVLSGLLDLGVTGATIVDAEGMGRILSDEIPLFAGLQAAVPDRPRHAMVLSVVAERLVDPVIEYVQEVLGDLATPATGIVFVLPVERVVGLKSRLARAEEAEDGARGR